MSQDILQILLDESNRDYYIRHYNAIHAALAQRKMVLEQPALTNDEFWSRTETTE